MPRFETKSAQIATICNKILSPSLPLTMTVNVRAALFHRWPRSRHQSTECTDAATIGCDPHGVDPCGSDGRPPAKLGVGQSACIGLSWETLTSRNCGHCHCSSSTTPLSGLPRANEAGFEAIALHRSSPSAETTLLRRKGLVNTIQYFVGADVRITSQSSQPSRAITGEGVQQLRGQATQPTDDDNVIVPFSFP